MSKLLKSFSILGILLLVAGGIVFCVALAAVDWDIFAFSDTNVVPQYYTEPTNASFDRVELYFANADVQITFVEGLEELSIEYPLLTDRNGNPRNEVTVTEKENGVTMTEKPIWHRNLISLFPFADPKVQVYLPMERTYHLAIFSDNGTISVETSNEKDGEGKPVTGGTVCSTRYVHLQSDNGSIFFADTSYITCSGSFSCHTDNGRIQLGTVHAASIYAETDNGSILMQGGMATEKVTLLSSNGTIEVSGDLQTEMIEMETDNGRIQSAGRMQATTLLAETDNGNIYLLGCVDAQNLTLTSDNGTLKAYVHGNRGDYSIDIDCDTGKTNLENQVGGSRHLTLKTDNGDIEVLFLGESYVAKEK